jgi:ATP/ADP translocase
MTLSELVTRALDVRPGEFRKVLLSFLGAYGVLSFLILSRALRNAFYVTTFDVTTLPYVTIAVAILTIPMAGAFGVAMARRHPHLVYAGFCLGLATLLAGFFLVAPAAPEIAAVAFYLVTVLGGSLLTSGFWMVTSEHYSLRQAKRLFGLVGAGGTLGAMITGLSVNRLTQVFSTLDLVLGLVALPLAVVALHLLMPRIPPHHHHDDTLSGTQWRAGIELVKRNRQLRHIATIVLLATMVSTVLDYQFIDAVSNAYTGSDRMAGFFAAFYGWTGMVSLLVQVLLAGRLMAGAGLTVSLAILPALLLAGSAAMLVVPAPLLFWAATGVRGVDNSLRKSLHRSVLEYLFVPVAPRVRRRTKAFIDTVIDNVAGGVAAGLLFLLVTWGGLPARYLSLLTMALALAFLTVAVRTGAQYRRTLKERLADDSGQVDMSDFDGRSLLTVTLTRLDVEAELARAGISLDEDGDAGVRSGAAAEQTPGEGAPAGLHGLSTDELLAHPDSAVVARVLESRDDWGPEHVEALTRLLARGELFAPAVEALCRIGEPAVTHLIEELLDEHADFVIRRRTPRVLADIDSPAADQALLDALAAGRFEVRYRAAIALSRRRAAGMATAPGNWQSAVWRAVEREVSRDRPIWELQRILDGAEAGDDDFVGERVGVRGELSLEHTFRQLALVLDHDAVKTAFHGIVMDDEELKGLSLEYLEQVLPPKVRDRLWPFIGDVSDYQRRRSMRSVDEVVRELSETGVTLFRRAADREALDEALRARDRKKGEADR